MVDSDRIPVGASPFQGPSDALVTIVVFSDFQCPFCARVEGTLRALRERYGDDLRIVWKNLPLPFHEFAMPAAEAAMAAHAQGRFWPMHSMIFEHQSALTRDDLEHYAEELGLDMERFRNDLNTHTHRASIQADIALAERVRAQGTPNLFINGTQVVGAQPFDRFARVVDLVLARARTMTPRNRVYAEMAASPVPTGDPDEDGHGRPPGRRPPTRQLAPDTVYNVPVGHSPVRGPADALVTIVVFSDFQCPFCGRVELTEQQVLSRYGNDVRLVWKNQPLPFHNRAMPAAEAAMEVYAQQGSRGFWQFHDTLFQNQGHLEEDALLRYATAQHVNPARLRSALSRHTHEAAIRMDVDLARSIAADGTPHFFINGRRLVGAQPLEQFTHAIDAALVEARRTVAAGIPRARVYEHLTGHGATEVVYEDPSPAPDGDGAADPDVDRIYVVPPNPQAPSRGGAHAAVILELFSDFQCPFCARLEPVLGQIRSTYGDRVRIVWRDYPLSFHTNAMPAAEAAREVLAQQGNAGFWRYHDTLFAAQTALDRAALERYAREQGLDLARFRAALDRHTHVAAIRQDIAAADSLAVPGMGTPASFINGRFVSGAQPFAVFQRVIDAALGASARP